MNRLPRVESNDWFGCYARARPNIAPPPPEPIQGSRVSLVTGDHKRLTMHAAFVFHGARLSSLLVFTASGPQSTPSRRASAPSGLRPKQPPALDARSTCRGPTHTGLRSSANNRLSRHTLVLARRAASRREPQAEPELPRPLAWLDPSLLLLGSWWWSSPSLVPQRSRPVRMSPTPISKGFFSYTPPRLGIRFALGVRLYQK